MDAVEAAQSGHPGTPMALAPAGYVLWRRHLNLRRTTPTGPIATASSSPAVTPRCCSIRCCTSPVTTCSLDDIRQFRQWGSKTPGHPERGHTAGRRDHHRSARPGIEQRGGHGDCRADPRRAVQPPEHVIVDHRTWVFASDGDMMEGVASEAASLAGHLALGKLTVLYDDNHITIDGRTDLAFTEDVEQRYEAYGWRVLHVDDGNDLEAIDAALADAGSAVRAADADRAAHHHCRSRAHQARHLRGARRAAGQGRDGEDQGDPGLADRIRSMWRRRPTPRCGR